MEQQRGEKTLTENALKKGDAGDRSAEGERSLPVAGERADPGFPEGEKKELAKDGRAD